MPYLQVNWRQFHTVWLAFCSFRWSTWDTENKRNGISHNITRNHLKKLKREEAKEEKNNLVFRRMVKARKQLRKWRILGCRIMLRSAAGRFPGNFINIPTSFYTFSSKHCSSNIHFWINTWEFWHFPKFLLCYITQDNSSPDEDSLCFTDLYIRIYKI